MDKVEQGAQSLTFYIGVFYPLLMLSDKKLGAILAEVSEKIANPFNINDICLYFGIKRGKEGRETLDLEYGINSHVVSHFVMRSDDFERAETSSSGGRALWKRVIRSS